MRKYLNLILLSMSFMAVSCGSSEEENKESKKKTEAGNPVVATATVTFVDEDNRKQDFNGEKPGQFSPAKENNTVADITEAGDQWVMRIMFKDKKEKIEIDLLVARKEGRTAVLTTGSYDINNTDFLITYQVYAQKKIFHLMPNMTHLKYNNQDIVQNGNLTITKISDSEIKGTFMFDGYSFPSDPLTKIEVRNGQFEGTIRQMP